jgi:hypothetical protein
MANCDHYKKETMGELKEDILAQLRKNHMWINAFATIRPTDEVKLAIGEHVLKCLAERDNVLPSYHHGEPDDKPIHEIAKLSGCIYLSFNAS